MDVAGQRSSAAALRPFGSVCELEAGGESLLDLDGVIQQQLVNLNSPRWKVTPHLMCVFVFVGQRDRPDGSL